MSAGFVGVPPERILGAIAEATPDFLYAFDLSGRILFANRRLLEVWGVSAELAAGRSLHELGYPQWHADMHMRELRQVIETKMPVQGVVPFTGGSGISGVYEYIFTPVLDARGEVEFITGTTRDVTRRQNDARMAAHLAAIVESSDDAIISKDLEGVIQSWNAGAERVFGYTSAETVGRSILMLIPPERHREEDDILARLRAGERIEHFESVRVAKGGRRIDVSLTISPVKDASGRIIAASKIARNISRQKQIERELQAAKETAERAEREKDELLRKERASRTELERASRMKDEFLATLSHELRTPLNAVLGWSQVLARGPLSADTREGVQIIERNARAQAQIIEDLLDMNRIVSGRLRLDVQRIDLPAIISAAVETVSAAAEAKDVRIQTALDPLAGPLSGDPSRLQQVFWNLLSNAVKFTPKGGRIQVLLERVDSNAEVSVIDTGEGIDAAFLPHVFDRFTQADGGSNRRHSGLGLGLAIVKQLVELHGGSVRVESGGIGTGAAFTVVLPVAPLYPDPQSEGDSDRRYSAIGGMTVSAALCRRIAGIKVLVVDDEPDARALVKRLLEDCSAIVITAGTADEAMDLLRRESPDVLVSDIGMPHQDGYALIRRIRGLAPEAGGDVPAIALTAYARAEDRMRAIVAGFQQHVVKPVEPAELITLVAILADRKTAAERGPSPPE